jgi:hypothetical protein
LKGKKNLTLESLYGSNDEKTTKYIEWLLAFWTFWTFEEKKFLSF